MKIGDIIVALPEADMRYSITNTSMGKACVVGVNGDQIEIKVLGKGKFDVDSKFFKKIGEVKPFDRTEVIRLLSKGKTTEIFDYDLIEADLSGADLSGANLREANLRGANLSGADLSEANLYEANLRGADLSGADLRGADLSGANLYEANLRGANLRGANLREANLRGADLSEANLYEANLRGADLSGANLRGANLRGADLSGANLRGANLYEANLRGADLSGANLRGADLSEANLREANLRGANLSGADLSGADLSGANLREANLRGANLSGALNLLESCAYIDDHFEKTDKGYIAYKTFGSFNTPPAYWTIEPDSIICENVNFNRTEECGCGVNVGTLEWVKENTTGQIWKVLIEWPWLAGVVVPYSTDGKIRCERVRLLEKIER